MPTYYPSVKTRLIVRFDEFGNSELNKAAPPKPTTLLSGIVDNRAPLKIIPDPNAPANSHRLLITDGSSASNIGPQKQEGSSDKLTFVLGGIIPKQATWNMNGLRDGDRAEIVLRLVDCPIDPRTIRACAVELYMGTVTEEDFVKGLEGGTRATKGSATPNTAEPLNVVPDEYTDGNGNVRTNLRFQGFVDKWETEFNEEGEPMLRLSCRDNTALLVDQQAPAKLVVGTSKPIDAAVADYLSNFPRYRGMTVEYRPNTDTPPKLNQALAGTSFRPKLGPPLSKSSGGAEKLAVWDYLTDVCGSIGHTIRVEGTTIIIQKPTTLLGTKGSKRSDDPFAGRTVDGQQFQYRRFIYGNNLKKMTIARTFAKHAPTNIEVRSYSTRRKKTLVVRFPERADRIAISNPGDESTEQKWMVWKVTGIEDTGTLKTFAQTIYQSFGRNEISIVLDTKNLSSFGGDNTDPDVLDMKTGDTFELFIRRNDDTNTLNQIESSMLAQERGKEFLKGLGFDSGFADAYAKAYNDAGFQSQFRLKTMAINWDIEEGMSLSINGQNYVEVRSDKPFGQ